MKVYIVMSHERGSYDSPIVGVYEDWKEAAYQIVKGTLEGHYSEDERRPVRKLLFIDNVQEFNNELTQHQQPWSIEEWEVK